MGVARGEHLPDHRLENLRVGLPERLRGRRCVPARRKEISLESTGCILPSQIITLTSRAYEPVSGSLLDAVHQAFHNRRNEARVDPRRLRYSCTQPVFPPHSRGISRLSRTFELELLVAELIGVWFRHALRVGFNDKMNLSELSRTS